MRRLPDWPFFGRTGSSGLSTRPGKLIQMSPAFSKGMFRAACSELAEVVRRKAVAESERWTCRRPPDASHSEEVIIAQIPLHESGKSPQEYKNEWLFVAPKNVTGLYLYLLFPRLNRAIVVAPVLTGVTMPCAPNSGRSVQAPYSVALPGRGSDPVLQWECCGIGSIAGTMGWDEQYWSLTFARICHLRCAASGVGGTGLSCPDYHPPGLSTAASASGVSCDAVSAVVE
jgi:hypothetical protein